MHSRSSEEPTPAVSGCWNKSLAAPLPWQPGSRATKGETITPMIAITTNNSTKVKPRFFQNDCFHFTPRIDIAATPLFTLVFFKCSQRYT
jgi:hypothetical protein